MKCHIVLVVALCLIASGAFARPETRRSWEYSSKEAPKTCGYDVRGIKIVYNSYEAKGKVKECGMKLRTYSRGKYLSNNI